MSMAFCCKDDTHKSLAQVMKRLRWTTSRIRLKGLWGRLGLSGILDARARVVARFLGVRREAL